MSITATCNCNEGKFVLVCLFVGGRTGCHQFRFAGGTDALFSFKFASTTAHYSTNADARQRQEHASRLHREFCAYEFPGRLTSMILTPCCGRFTQSRLRQHYLPDPSTTFQEDPRQLVSRLDPKIPDLASFCPDRKRPVESKICPDCGSDLREGEILSGQWV